MEIITRKRTVWLTFLDVLYKKELPLQSIHAKGVPFLCDPGAIQTHDLQNRNLTLYSLSYGAILSKCEDKSIKNLLIFLMILLFLSFLRYFPMLNHYYFEMF